MQKISRETFATLVLGAGLSLTPRQQDDLYAAYPHIAAMVKRVRSRAQNDDHCRGGQPD